MKTGRNPGVTWQEQIAAYRRSPECLLPMGEIAPMPQTDAGMVLHLRPEYERGYKLMLISGADDAAAWNRFRRAVEIYRGRKAAKAKPGKVCYPLREDGTIRQPLLADLDGEGYGRALSPLVKAGIDRPGAARRDGRRGLPESQGHRREDRSTSSGSCSPTTACTSPARPPRLAKAA